MKNRWPVPLNVIRRWHQRAGIAIVCKNQIKIAAPPLPLAELKLQSSDLCRADIKKIIHMLKITSPLQTLPSYNSFCMYEYKEIIRSYYSQSPPSHFLKTFFKYALLKADEIIILFCTIKARRRSGERAMRKAKLVPKSRGWTGYPAFFISGIQPDIRFRCRISD